MRLSLLLPREPFPVIFAQTMSRFLLSWTGKPHEIHWDPKRPLSASHCRSGEFWLVNIYLNAIFLPQADPAIFDPVKQEFSRSLVWWRRWPQRLYVEMATSPLTAKWLAHAGVSLTPALPQAELMLMVPGNHKIRLLDYGAKTVYAIRKSGFPANFLEREIEVRRQAEELGLPVPRVKTVAGDGAWLSEEYVSGTPVNRLKDPAQARAAFAEAHQALTVLHRHTFREVNTNQYVDLLSTEAHTHIEANALITPGSKRLFFQTLDSLVARIQALLPAGGNRLPTVLAHGDFQPANILVDADRLWLIDWEYSRRRQAAYDVLTFILESRFTRGLSGRLQRMITQGIPDGGLLEDFSCYASGWQDSRHRLLYGSLFLLEEMALRLEESNNPSFVQLDNGLTILQQEISYCL
ncbi:MAG: aminoglycoside phosphotransferase family protein [Syntrophales bacterium]|nr:aminoglycoside phosphotransferase family protein [Syntrophales bacterium]